MLPPGFERLLLRHAVAVARSDLALSIRRSLMGADGRGNTLHDFAAGQRGARVLQGRGAAYAITLPHSNEQVVVRHNRHGGAFAMLTGDRFLAPTRAPRELVTSLELTRRGVPTPAIVAYVLYPPGGIVQRADVASREIAGGRDLAAVLEGSDAQARASALRLAAVLVGQLARAGARHPDLNAKNILIAADGAWVLDVDRVMLDQPPAEALAANLGRLTRSLRKRRQRAGAAITDDDLAALERNSRDALGAG